MSHHLAISTKNLVKRYPQAQKNAVDGVDLAVETGEIYGFLGPNGAGKSTAVQIFATTLFPTSGTVRVAGYDPVHQAKEVRQRIGVVFQNASLDRNLSIEENLRFQAQLYGLTGLALSFSQTSKRYQQRVEEVLTLFGLWDRRNELVKTLSGGLKRRADIAKALLHTPEILFLDEPTTGLDPQSRRAVWQYLSKLQSEKNFTLFLTTQYLEEAEICNRISIIDQGKIQITNTPRALKHQLGEEQLLLTAEKPAQLEKELRTHGFSFELLPSGEHALALKDQGAQEVLQKITTPLVRFTMKEPSLDDVFLHVTGHTLEGKNA